MNSYGPIASEVRAIVRAVPDQMSLIDVDLAQLTRGAVDLGAPLGMLLRQSVAIFSARYGQRMSAGEIESGPSLMRSTNVKIFGGRQIYNTPSGMLQGEDDVVNGRGSRSRQVEWIVQL